MTSESQHELMGGKKRLLVDEVSETRGRPPEFQESFAEIWLDNEWVKVEIVERSASVGGHCIVERLDVLGHGSW